MSKKQTIQLKNVFAFSWKALISQKWGLFIAIFLMIASTLIEIGTRYMYGEITDALVNQSAYKFIITLFIGWIMVEILHHITRKSANLIWGIFVQAQSMKGLYIKLFDKVQHFSSNWFANNFVGAIIRKINRGVYAFERLSDIFFQSILPITTIFIGSIILLFFYSITLGVIAAIGGILFLIFVIFLSVHYIIPRYRKNLDADTHTAAFIADSISGNITVKSFSQEKKEYDELHKRVIYWMKTKIRSWIATDLGSFLQSMVLMTMQIVLVFSSLHMWRDNQLSIGDVVFIIFLAQLIWGYLSNIAGNIRDILQSSADLEDAISYIEMPLQVSDIPEAQNIKITSGSIEFKDIYFQYENQNEAVFNNFSINIKAGERVALVGKSGSGKSTFVKLLQRLYDIQSGEIFIDKQNIASVTQESLRKNISLVPQDPILFHRSLAENIAYGKPCASKKDIESAAKKAHAHEFISKFPQGYETLVGERGVKLSGGERQRVAIARAILANTPILVLDEATSSLDSESEKYIQNSIHNLLEAKTAIIIAHRLSTIKEVDRIIVFDKGKIIEDGCFVELIKKNKVFAKMWEMQKLD